MKVTGSPQNTTAQTALNGVAGKKPTKADGKNSSAAAEALSAEKTASAQVQVSGRAKDIQRAKEIARGAPDIDEAKVAKFQKLIDSGEYKVDAKKVADKLVDDHLMTELGSQKE